MDIFESFPSNKMQKGLMLSHQPFDSSILAFSD
ncbi:hypothetical protein AND4_13541 [Vibrio sp. AND4]|nr:hypothetical protein AND4_13541 [Vibrio sp. AND4]